MPWEKRPENSINLRLDVPLEARDKLRVVAAQHGQSMAAYLRSLVLEHVKMIQPPTAPEPSRKPRRRKTADPTP
jgi:plasmid stability protein